MSIDVVAMTAASAGKERVVLKEVTIEKKAGKSSGLILSKKPHVTDKADFVGVRILITHKSPFMELDPFSLFDASPRIIIIASGVYKQQESIWLDGLCINSVCKLNFLHSLLHSVRNNRCCKGLSGL